MKKKKKKKETADEGPFIAAEERNDEKASPWVSELDLLTSSRNRFLWRAENPPFQNDWQIQAALAQC